MENNNNDNSPINKKEYQQSYRQKNKDKYLEYQKKYRENNQDKITELRKNVSKESRQLYNSRYIKKTRTPKKLKQNNNTVENEIIPTI